MQNLNPFKKNLRLSRFSSNFNVDMLKGLMSFSSKDSLDRRSSNQNDSSMASKKSIFVDQKRGSKDFKNLQDDFKQIKQQDIFTKELLIKKTKFYEIEEIKIYRETLFQLPYLQQKSKKIKNKHISPQFIEFFFNVMRDAEFIQKIFASFIEHESIVNQFLAMTDGFQIKKFHSGRTIEITKDDKYFYIFLDGISDKATVKNMSRLERKSLLQNLPSSSTSLVRRSGSKNKTITSKNKVICFQQNTPILINQKQFHFCSLKTVSECTFLLLEKQAWSKFLIQLQKLQEKQLVNFIKKWTSINLNICTINQLAKKDNLIVRKTFLYDLKNPKAVNQQIEIENLVSDRALTNQKKITIHGNAISTTYKLFNLGKDEKISIDNQNIYLVIKGSVFLTTNSYSIIINEGSIINTSILLNLEPETVKIKALTQCSIVKLLLDQIYFKKQDQNQFINKIQEIESFRNHINRVSSHPNLPNLKQNLSLTIYSNTFRKNQAQNLSNHSNKSEKQNKFDPEQLRVHDLNIEKGQNKRNRRKYQERICHHYKKIKTQPCQSQSFKKSLVRYANNYCIFQKIVQSKQKISQSIKLNNIEKIFPIKDLLQNHQFKKSLDLQTDNSRKSTIKKSTIINFIDQNKNTYESTNRQISFQIPEGKNQPIQQKNMTTATTLKTVKKRRDQFEKTLIERKKKQKYKIIENLFYINFDDNKKNQSSKNGYDNLRFSSQFHPDRISLMIRRSSQSKLSEMQGQSFQDLIREKKQKKYLLTKTSRGKFDKNFLVTQPNYSEIKNLQKVFSSENIHNQTWSSNIGKNKQVGVDHLQHQNNISKQFLKLKKMTTKKIQTTMLNGRIRDSKSNKA